MVDATAFDVVPASEVGDVVRLEALARDVFGPGQRPQGWFARKLRREHVDPALSRVAVASGCAPQDAGAWLGYVLVGTPPSLGTAARTAGTGVLARARGHGIASALLDAAAQATAASGRAHLELVAEAPTEAFYRARGFVVVRRLVTVLEFGRGAPPGRRIAAASAHEDEDGATELDLGSALLPEAWHGTEATARHCIRTAGARARITDEGRAALVHGVGADDRVSLDAALDEVLDALAPARPALLAMLDEVSPITARLQSRGWSPVQRGTLLRRPSPR